MILTFLCLTATFNKLQDLMIINHKKNFFNRRINGTISNKVTKTSFLGLNIDNDPSFKSHIKQTENKVSRGLYASRTAQHLLPATGKRKRKKHRPPPKTIIPCSCSMSLLLQNYLLTTGI